MLPSAAGRGSSGGRLPKSAARGPQTVPWQMWVLWLVLNGYLYWRYNAPARSLLPRGERVRERERARARARARERPRARERLRERESARAPARETEREKEKERPCVCVSVCVCVCVSAVYGVCGSEWVYKYV